MYIQAVCRNCGRSVSIDYSILDGETALRCPACNRAICHNDASHLFALIEKYRNAKQMLNGMDITGVYDGKGSRVVEDDIGALEMIYHKSDPGIKSQIERIVDQLYVTLYEVIRTGNGTGIAQIAEKMQSIFNWYIEQKNEEVKRFICDDSADTE